MCFGLEQELTRLSGLQHLCIEGLHAFELPPGRWQGQLTSVEECLRHLRPAHGSPSSAAAMLAHATALKQFQVWVSGFPSQSQLRALLGALAALELVLLHGDRHWEPGVQEAHTALGSPLGERLRWNKWPNNPYLT